MLPSDSLHDPRKFAGCPRRVPEVQALVTEVQVRAPLVPRVPHPEGDRKEVLLAEPRRRSISGRALPPATTDCVLVPMGNHVSEDFRVWAYGIEARSSLS